MNEILASLLAIIAGLIGYVFIDFKKSVSRVLSVLEDSVDAMQEILKHHEQVIEKHEERINNLEKK